METKTYSPNEIAEEITDLKLRVLTIEDAIAELVTVTDNLSAVVSKLMASSHIHHVVYR